MKKILITGGCGGIGFAAAKLLSKENKIYCIDIIVDEETKLDNIEFIKCDITDQEQVKECIKKIMFDGEKINALINCAAIQTESPIDKMSVEEFKKVIDVNLTGTFITIKESLNYLISGSTILNISSVHAEKPRRDKCHYDASKAGINMLTKSLAIELADRKITINSLSFGAVKTKMNHSWLNNEKECAHVKSKVLLEHIFESNEIAVFIETILRDFSRYTTGTNFTIDGGRSLI